MGKKYEIEKGWVERKEGKIGDRKRGGKYVYLPGKLLVAAVSSRNSQKLYW